MGSSTGKNQVNDQEVSHDELWMAYVRAEQAADEALRVFMAALPPRLDYQGGPPDVVGHLAPRLHGRDCIYALRVLERSPETERRRLLPDLVAVASTHTWAPEFLLARPAIASLDRKWLEANIEPCVWQQLGPDATDWQYRRLAELLRGLGMRDLLNKVIERASANADENIREVAEDFVPDR
jgi:hypothetical protein